MLSVVLGSLAVAGQQAEGQPLTLTANIPGSPPEHFPAAAACTVSSWCGMTHRGEEGRVAPGRMMFFSVAGHFWCHLGACSAGAVSHGELSSQTAECHGRIGFTSHPQGEGRDWDVCSD